MIHNCNKNPLWYHKLIRPIIRKKVGYNMEWQDGGISNSYVYWVKRPWYRYLTIYIALIISIWHILADITLPIKKQN